MAPSVFVAGAVLVGACSSGGTDPGPGGPLGVAAPATSSPQCDFVAAEVIDVSADWAVGDVRRFEITRRTEADGRLLGGSTQQATMSVLDRTSAGGWLLRWTTRERFITAAAPALTRDTFEALQDGLGPALLDIDYEVDRAGAVVALADRAGLRRQMNSLADDALDIFGRQLDAHSTLRVGQLMDRFIGDDSYIDTAVTDELRLYHSLYGLMVEVDRSSRSAALLPNVLGGEAIPAVATVDASPDTGGGCAGIERRVTPERGELTRQLTDSLVASLDREPTAEERLDIDATVEAFSIEDHTAMAFDVGSGWVREAVNTQIVESADIRRVEVTAIVDLP